MQREGGREGCTTHHGVDGEERGVGLLHFHIGDGRGREREREREKERARSLRKRNFEICWRR